MEKTTTDKNGFTDYPVSEYSLLGDIEIKRRKGVVDTKQDKWNAISYLVDGKEIMFIHENANTKWRIDTLFEKEPHTLAWLNRFEENETFIDIGANIGLYSIWAAAMRGANVYAFEPDGQNFALLNKNIFINNLYLNKKVLAYCCAISDSIHFSELFSTDCSAGTSYNDFDERLPGRVTKFVQGCISVSIDELVSTGAIPPPDHIKIDVDGYEHLAVLGCREVIESGSLKSILIEIDSNDENHLPIIDYMLENGYTYSQEQVEGKRSMQTAPSVAGTGNYIFYKDEKYKV